jgi:predicted nucleic acid-binding Zn ribbon protein
MIGCKDSQPPGQSSLIQDLFAMLFRVDIAMATTEITPSEYMKKEISRVGLKLDCSAFYLHKFQ